MGGTAERYRRRCAAKSEIAEILQHPRNAVIVHYSCESFYDRPDGSSPRVTSIAVRNLATAQTTSFSIHQVAERSGIDRTDIETQYNCLEKMMLEEFYQYVEAHKDHKWLHWNMRDINYGFPAISHRIRVLGGAPVELHESNLRDLARMMIDLFGPAYAGHPRLARLIELNRISAKDLLTGQQEADAFVQKEYVKLHQSTLRKVDVMANLFNRLADGTLKTNASKVEIYGSWLGYWVELLRDHPAAVVITFLASVASIISLLAWLLHR